MTIKELYTYAKENNAEDFSLGIFICHAFPLKIDYETNVQITGIDIADKTVDIEIEQR